MYKHIIWDFDGTLFDTYPVITEAFRQELEAEGISEPFDEIMKYTKASMTLACDHYKEKYHLGQEFFDRYKLRCHEMEHRICRPYDGMSELCRYISDSGRRNYLYTHRSDTALLYLKDQGLYDYFTDFIISKSGFERKPSPEALLYLIGKHHIKPKPEEAIMIGDREIDILAAKNAGIHSCFFSESDENCDAADYNVRSAQEIKSII